MIKGWNPGGARVSTPVQTGLGAHPAGGVKRPGRGIDHHPDLGPKLRH